MARETVRFETFPCGRRIWVETHTAPHGDELLSKPLLERYATPAFLREYAPKGVIQVGVGEGPFDDHIHGGSSAMLLAKALKCDRVAQVKTLIDYVHRIDSLGGDQKYNLVNVMKVMGMLGVATQDLVAWADAGFAMKIGELEPNKDFSIQHVALLLAMEKRNWKGWLEFGMSALVEDHFDFVERAAADFKAAAKIETIPTPKGPAVLCHIESDSHAIMRYARSEHGARAHIVIKRGSSGNVAIQVDKRLGLDLGDVVAMIKLEEQRARGMIHCDDPDALRAEGTLNQEWDVWHYAHGAHILNGSHSAQGIDPTKISLERLVEIVKIALNPKHYAPEHADMCHTGMCSASMGLPCPLAPYGLSRCRAIQGGSAS